MSLLTRAQVHTNDILLNNLNRRGASKVVSVRVPDQVYQELCGAAKHAGVPVSYIVAYILDNFQQKYIFFGDVK